MSFKTFGIMPVLPWLALSLMFCSCTVKEDRSGCPCRTYLIVDEFIRAGFRKALVSYEHERNILRKELELVKYAGLPYEKAFPRASVSVSVASGLDAAVPDGDILLFPYGSEADPVWIFHDVVECTGDEQYVNAVPYKQYCNLSILVAGLSSGDEYGFRFRIRASCNGIDLFTGQPVSGEYCSMARQIAPDRFSVRIPRQDGSVLLLEMVGDGNADGTVVTAVRTIDLGREFSASGYDWTSESLDDASAVVDYSKADVTVSVDDWNHDESFSDIEI